MIHALWDGSAGLLAPLQQALPDRVDPGGGEGTEVAGALFSALVAGALPVYGAVLLLVWIVRRRLCDGARCRELARAPEPLS